MLHLKGDSGGLTPGKLLVVSRGLHSTEVAVVDSIISDNGSDISVGGPLVATRLSGSLIYRAIAAGTAYALTDTQAALDFGTTDPSVTLAVAGTYILSGMAQVELVGTTYVANQTLTVKTRKTSGTPADVTGSTATITLPIVTTITQTLMQVMLPPVEYVATANDVLALFGAVNALPGAGTVEISAAWLMAQLK